MGGWFREHAALGALVPFGLAAVATFGVIAPPEHCPSVSEDDLRAAATSAAGWIEVNQLDDGSFRYEYSADEQRDLPGYNVVRHAGVVMSMYMAAGYGVAGTLETGDRGLEWAEAHLTRGDGWIAAGDGPTRPSVGASALLLAGLAERRDATGGDEHDALMRGLAAFLVGQIEPSGSVTNVYDVAAGGPRFGVPSKYATGEAYWALAQAARQFPGEGWDTAADRIGAYIAADRDEAEGMRHTRDHWAAYGLSESVASGDADHDRTLTGDEAAYARHQAEILGVIVRWMSQQNGPWGVAVRGPALQRGGAFGTIGEALTRLWRVADTTPELADLREPLAARALCNAAITMEHQVDASDVDGAADADRRLGAWFYGGTTRMDDQQHALSSLLQAIDIVRAGSPSGDEWGGDRPAVVLWTIAIVAAINPLRVARAHGRRRPGPWIAVAAGALIAAALLARPLLDAVDVSGPSFRVAAGVLGVIAGAAAFVRRRRDDVGAVAAILTVPAFAMVMGTAVDRGALAAVDGIVIAALLTALVAWTLRPGRAASAAERAVDGVLLVVAVLITVAGVMAV